MKLRRDDCAGQILVVVLLVMAVVLTVVLSAASRSITSVSVSRKEEEALRAFSAAEAGIERALVSTGVATLSDSLERDVSYTAHVSGIAEGSGEYYLPVLIASGEAATVWFVSHDSIGRTVCDAAHPCFVGKKLRVCWGQPGTSSSSPSSPVVQLNVFYLTSVDDFATSSVARAIYDANSSRASGSGFSSPSIVGGCTITQKNLAFGTDIDLNSLGVPSNVTSNPNLLKLARLKLLFGDMSHPVGVSVNDPANGGSTLPRQGDRVESVGSAGEANRKIVVERIYSSVPSIFDYGLFSGSGSLTK